MKLSVLERVLFVERHRRQASAAGGFSLPVMLQDQVSPEDEPLMVSNMRGDFLEGRRSKDGVSRFAFFPCPLEREDEVLRQLCHTLLRISTASNWGNRCRSVSEAMAFMVRQGLEPRTRVAPLSLLKEACGVAVGEDEAENLMLAQGHIAEVDGVRLVTTTALPQGAALLAAAPAIVGTYFRVDDCLGVMIRQANRSLVLVGDALGG
jgi:hypothetical protein